MNLLMFILEDVRVLKCPGAHSRKNPFLLLRQQNAAISLLVNLMRSIFSPTPTISSSSLNHAPSSVPNIYLASIRKVLRWALRLSTYNYVCFQIKGKDKIWPDLLTFGWFISPTIRRLVSITPLPTAFQDFVWPTFDTIR